MFRQPLAARPPRSRRPVSVTKKELQCIPSACPACTGVQAGARPLLPGTAALKEDSQRSAAFLPGETDLSSRRRDGLRAERAGERRPPTSDVPPGRTRVGRRRSTGARVRALAPRRRAALVADAAAGARRLRQLALQRALGVRRRPAA